MYTHIIVPMALDHGFGETALTLSRKLLAKDGRITALHVYEAPHGSVSAYLDEHSVQEAYAAAKDKLNKRVEGIADVTPVIIKGHSGRTTIDYAKETEADCIVIGSHKPGLIDYLLGSTAARVVRHAPCAVHVLRNLV